MTNHPIKYESYRTISDEWHSQNEEGWTDGRKNEKLYVYIPILSYTGHKKNLAIWLFVACSKNKTNNILRK
jgi:hypothetical protein